MTKVLPILRMLNMAGALTSYQSFFEKGSTLHKKNTEIVKPKKSTQLYEQSLVLQVCNAKSDLTQYQILKYKLLMLAHKTKFDSINE